MGGLTLWLQSGRATLARVKVIPVIDLKRGRVVRGVGGARSRYQPIRSRLCRTALPFDVARGFIRAFGLRELYVADLDAITGEAVDERSLGEVVRAGGRVLLDAGIDSLERAQQVHAWQHAGSPLFRVIVALESLSHSSLLEEIAATLGSERVIFSLDLKEGRPLARATWDLASPLEIAERAVSAGFRQLIVLDLADVGMDGGNQSLAICEEVRRRWPELSLISGGGVRDRADLQRLAATGCDYALVASALHDGRLTRADVCVGEDQSERPQATGSDHA